MGVFVQLNEGTQRGRSNPIGYVICESGCWQWVGTVSTNGYGQWGNRRAHRAVYEMYKGPIPDGLQLDHLCRNRPCVNPDHLEPVTCRENILRGVGHTSQNARKTHCKRGHPLEGRNLRPDITRLGGRGCRLCSNARRMARYAADLEASRAKNKEKYYRKVGRPNPYKPEVPRGE